MTAPAIAPNHRALTSNAGNAKLYAEQLLTRVCRRWGITVGEVRGTRRTGQRSGDTIVRRAAIAEFIRDIEDHRQPRGTRDHTVVTRSELADLLNVSDRAIGRWLRVIGEHQARRHDPGAAATDRSPEAQVRHSSQEGCIPAHTDLASIARGTLGSNSVDGDVSRMTGYDRASMEEEVLGGGGA